MADPVTMAIIAGVGQVFQGFQQASAQEDAAKAAMRQAEYNAQIQRQQAAQILSNQRLQEQQKRKAFKARTSSQLAQIGKAGIELSGAPLSLVGRTIAEQELELLNDKYNADIQAYNARAGAQVSLMEGSTIAEEKYNQAQSSRMGGLTGAGGTILGGYQSAQAGAPPKETIYWNS